MALYAANDAVPAPTSRYPTCLGRSGTKSFLMEVGFVTGSVELEDQLETENFFTGADCGGGADSAVGGIASRHA